MKQTRITPIIADGVTTKTVTAISGVLIGLSLFLSNDVDSLILIGLQPVGAAYPIDPRFPSFEVTGVTGTAVPFSTHYSIRDLSLQLSAGQTIYLSNSGSSLLCRLELLMSVDA